MGKDSDQTFLFSKAILNDLVADEKRLHGWFGDISHGLIVEKHGVEGKWFLIVNDHTDGQQEILKDA